MAQSLHVNLAFSADTAKAKASIKELMSSLNQIANPKTQIFDDRGLREAANAAKDLQNHLAQAVNVNTGKLDLNKFSLSLSQSKQNLTDLYNSLSKAGPQGEQAFLQLASGIASSDSQVLNLNSKIKDLGVTLKNTVKWQLSSSLIHGFMGAVQGAIGYTRELNSSLNDIRIVTGYGADEMAKFADQANKAAKSLSTTTNNYAKASLIYFQQGLSDDEVQKRTDITVKMANVVNSNAELVSEQMTAVWNNFYDGSKSLEYYSDVMTALGAATASSTDEISEGLSKFAAVADTVGLSYEYATAALTTLTSNTRESADVVGNALKTLFARIQGLKLGETLEDGVDLNKYSEALDKVGISIFEQNGELKAMDNILNELGAKWDTLDKSQQVALAQTVAGVRQYTQLIALMENWDNGDADSMMANLNTAYSAEGALSEQFEIYEESWEAASNRIEASIERIYSALLNDEAIVSLMHGLEGILNLTGAILDGFGGMQGVLLLIGGIVSRTFAKEMPGAIDSLRQNFEIITGKAQKKKIGQMEQSKEILKNAMSAKDMSTGQQKRYEATINEIDAMMQLEQVRHRLSDAEYESRKNKIEEKKSIDDLVASKKDELDAIKKEYELKSKKQRTGKTNEQVARELESKDYDRQKKVLAQQRLGLEQQISRLEEKAVKKSKDGKTSGLTVNDSNDLMSYRTQLDEIKKQETEVNTLIERRNHLSEKAADNKALGKDDSYDTYLETTKTKLTELYELQTKQSLFQQDYQRQISSWNLDGARISLLDGDEQAKEFNKIRTAMKNYGAELQSFDSSLDLKNLNKALDTTENNVESLVQTFKSWAQSGVVIQELTTDAGKARGMTEQLEQQIDAVSDELKQIDPQNFRKIADEAQEAGERTANLNYEIQKLENEASMKAIPIEVDTMQFSEALMTLGSLGFEVSALITEGFSTLQVVFDENATAAEKFSAVLSTIPAMLFSIAEIMQIVKNGNLIEVFTAIGGGLTKLATKIPKITTLFGGVTAAATGAGVAAGTAATGFTALAVGLGKVLLAAAPWLLIGAAVAGVIWAIYESINGAVNEAEQELESITEVVNGMTEAANQANDAYTDLLNTISSYGSAVEGLKSLESGTAEFTNQLIEANQYARELIDKYGILSNEYFVNDQGLIQFKSGVLDQKQYEYQEKRESIQSGLSNSKAIQNEKENNLNLAKLEREIGIRALEGADQLKITQQYYEKMIEASGTIENFKGLDPEEQKKILMSALTNDARYKEGNVARILQNLDLFSDYQTSLNKNTIENEGLLKSDLINIMSNEQSYQDSNFKNFILKELENDYVDALDNAEAARMEDSDDKIQSDFATYLEEAGYYKDPDTNKVYEVNEDGTVGDQLAWLSNLDIEGMREILAGNDAADIIEQQGNNLANSLQTATKDLNEEEKEVADALLNGDLSGLTEDQINKMSEMSAEELTAAYPFIAQLEALETDVNTLLNQLTTNLNNWQPPEFNLETWKSDYAARMKVINDLETGDTISTKDYALLGEEYQQYFKVQADGTAILIAKAEDLKSAIDNISLESLKKEIGSQQSNLDKAEDIFNKSNNSKMSLDAITSKAEQGLLSTEQQTQYIQAVTEAFGGQYESAEAAAAAIRSYQASLNENQNILASTADNIDELNEMMKQGDIDAEEYYNNIDGTVLKEANKEGFDTEELLEYAETLESVIEDQENAESISKRLALQNQKLQKGIDSLGDNWEDWNKALKTGNKNSKNYIEALTGIKDAMSDMLDIDVSLLSEEFVTSSETAKLLEKAVKGDLDAIDQLRIAAAKDIVQKVTVDLDEASQESVLASIMELANTDVTIGASLDSTGFTNALNEMILNSQMTIDDIMNILNALGWEPEITYKEIPVGEATQSQIAQAVEIYDPVSGNWETATVHSISNAHQDAVVRVPIIQGSSTTYGGSAKTAATPPTPKSSGGGSKSKKETKQRDDKVERYHVVKEQMEELEKQAEKLSKAKDQAFGKGKLDLIEKEIELLDEQIKKQDEYLKQIQKYGEEDKALMIVYGAEFDENGVITNYEQLMDQELARYNAAVESYNKNHDEKKFAAAEARYEKFLSDMEQYEETMDEWDEAQAARADMIRKNYDLRFEALTYEIEVGIELEEDDLKLLDYYLEKLDDDAFSAAESITLLGKKTQDLLDQSKIYSDGIADLLSLHGLSDERINQYMNGSLTEQELITIGFSDEDIATLREYRDNLLEINKDLSNIREEIYAKIIDAFDAWNEKIIDSIDKIEKLNKVLNSYQNIIDIVGINTLKIDDKFMNNLSNAIVDNSKKVLDASVKKYKSLQNAQLQAQQQYEQSLIEGNEETIRYWEETLEHINNEVQNAEQDMMDSWQNALQAAADAFDKSIENIINSFEKALSGSFGNLDNLSEMFEQQTEISDRYLADYEKIYQLSKLNRDINNSIDDTDSIKAKRILKSLQEEINDLQNSEKEMSQYDLEYLQKKYELKLAEIALEEAQNAKSTVRLMQDSEGNWSYVYTNDQEKISDAQQRYEDALFDMQVANEDYIQDLQEKALDAQKAMTEAIKSIDKTQFATEDAYKERIDQIREYYMDQQNYYYDEMAKALGNNKELYENDWLNYSNLTNYKISSDKEYVDNFAETTYAQIMGYNTIEEAQNNFIMATDIMVEEITESYTLWLSNINEIMDLAGTSIDTFASDTENNLDRINTKTNEVADSIDDLSQEIVDDFDYIIDTVSDWEDNYVNAIDTTIQANEDMYDSCNSLIGMLNNVDISISNTGKNFSSTAQQIAKAAADIAAAAQRAADAASNIGSGGPGVVPNPNPAPQKEITPIKVKLYNSPQGSFKIETWVNQNTIEKLKDDYPNLPYGYYLDQKGSNFDGFISKSDYDKLKKMMDSMDTGGYTGDWGPDGKIAMLHQKELVLNAEDTQNMLNAVNIVREIARVIDLNAGIQSLGLYLQNLSHLSSGIGNSGVQQSIQITAEFPDAVYHNEIEEAFKTLLNESSQYIGREK